LKLIFSLQKRNKQKSIITQAPPPLRGSFSLRRSGGGERVILQKKSNISISNEPFLISIYS